MGGLVGALVGGLVGGLVGALVGGFVGALVGAAGQLKRPQPVQVQLVPLYSMEQPAGQQRPEPALLSQPGRGLPEQQTLVLEQSDLLVSR
jgi:predicted lipid-binding transport protein (Tim44 family)